MLKNRKNPSRKKHQLLNYAERPYTGESRCCSYCKTRKTVLQFELDLNTRITENNKRYDVQEIRTCRDINDSFVFFTPDCLARLSQEKVEISSDVKNSVVATAV